VERDYVGMSYKSSRGASGLRCHTLGMHLEFLDANLLILVLGVMGRGHVMVNLLTATLRWPPGATLNHVRLIMNAVLECVV
jgi:hypothetical protein